MDYSQLGWLLKLLSADIPSGGLADTLYPERVSQRGRAQQAKDRKWDQAHDAARGHYANRNALVHNLRMPPMWQSRSTPSPWDYNLPQAAQQQASPMYMAPPAAPYPERGTARPPVMQAAPPVQQAAAPQVQQTAAPKKQSATQISPQDYYALLQAGLFRMG